MNWGRLPSMAAKARASTPLGNTTSWLTIRAREASGKASRIWFQALATPALPKGRANRTRPTPGSPSATRSSRAWRRAWELGSLRPPLWSTMARVWMGTSRLANRRRRWARPLRIGTPTKGRTPGSGRGGRSRARPCQNTSNNWPSALRSLTLAKLRHNGSQQAPVRVACWGSWSNHSSNQVRTANRAWPHSPKSSNRSIARALSPASRAARVRPNASANAPSRPRQAPRAARMAASDSISGEA